VLRRHAIRSAASAIVNQSTALPMYKQSLPIKAEKFLYLQSYSNLKKFFCQTTTISITHWDIVCRGQCSHLIATVSDSSLTESPRHCVNAAIHTVHKGSWSLDWINLVFRKPCEWTLNTRHWLWCNNTTCSSDINIAADEEIFQPLLNIFEWWFPLRC